MTASIEVAPVNPKRADKEKGREIARRQVLGRLHRIELSAVPAFCDIPAFCDTLPELPDEARPTPFDARAGPSDNRGPWRYLGALVDGQPTFWPGTLGMRDVEVADGEDAWGAALRTQTTSYAVDWKKARDTLASCGSTRVLVRTPPEDRQPGDEDVWRVACMRCGHRLCPPCCSARTGRAYQRWSRAADILLASGLQAYHVTLTQPRWASTGKGRVLADESWRWYGSDDPEYALAPVAGEGCFASGQRVYRSLRSLRVDRGTRELFERFSKGGIVGREWTLRNTHEGAPPVQSPRWHAHLHLLIFTDEEGASLWPRFCREWCAEVGGSMAAQSCKRVESSEYLIECLKYPLTVDDLTVAATAEAWTAIRGGRHHYAMGGLHGRSKLAQTAPWQAAIEAAKRAEHLADCLCYLTDEGWRPFSGQIDTGEAVFKAGSETWRGDVAPYLHALAGPVALENLPKDALDTATIRSCGALIL